jgi:predicted DNA-binding protein YlxM (UPF0122 family)
MFYPNWVTDPKLSALERESLRLTYLFRLAALNHNPDGSLPALAEAIGVSRETIYNSIREGRVTNLLATAIEHLVGPGVVSRDELYRETSSSLGAIQLCSDIPTA